MDVNQIAVAIRPRNHWEAIDLGFRLARQHWKALFAAWLVVFLPLAYIIHLIFGAGSSWGLLVIWWLKPVFDRVPLIVLSRAVFGSEPSVRETLASTPAALSPGVLPSLTLQRFDAARSFNLPVWQLESLRGKAWGQRVRTMEKRTKGAAGWHTVSCLCLVFIVFFALFALLGWMTPNEAGISLWWYFGEHFWEWLWPFGDEAPLWFGVLMNAPHVSAVAIIEPFYVAGGFTLYLNRRTILEGWDIEIAFRRMAPRVAAETGSEAA